MTRGEEHAFPTFRPVFIGVPFESPSEIKHRARAECLALEYLVAAEDFDVAVECILGPGYHSESSRHALLVRRRVLEMCLKVQVSREDFDRARDRILERGGNICRLTSRDALTVLRSMQEEAVKRFKHTYHHNYDV